jgi:hypothetical protein
MADSSVSEPRQSRLDSLAGQVEPLRGFASL